MNSYLTETIKSVIDKYRNIDFTRVFTYQQMINPYIEYCNNTKNYTIKTGLKNFDELTEGIRSGEVFTIISPTNTGKTSLVLQIIRNQTVDNSFLKDKLLINFTCELNEIDLLERELKSEFELNTNEIQKKIKKNDFINNLQEHFKKLDNIIHIINTISINEILPYCKAISEIKGKEIGLIVIDYLQLIFNPANSDEYHKITNTMKRIKEIALVLNVPVILTSQVSRNAFRNEIDITSGKGSGAIEEISQIVVSLERINELDKCNFSQEVIKEIEQGTYQAMILRILKKKRGKFGTVVLLFNNHNLTFTEYENKTITIPKIDF